MQLEYLASGGDWLLPSLHRKVAGGVSIAVSGRCVSEGRSCALPSAAVCVPALPSRLLFNVVTSSSTRGVQTLSQQVHLGLMQSFITCVICASVVSRAALVSFMWMISSLFMLPQGSITVVKLPLKECKAVTSCQKQSRNMFVTGLFHYSLLRASYVPPGEISSALLPAP